jgi:hypothetical protein
MGSRKYNSEITSSKIFEPSLQLTNLNYISWDARGQEGATRAPLITRLAKFTEDVVLVALL